MIGPPAKAPVTPPSLPSMDSAIVPPARIARRDSPPGNGGPCGRCRSAPDADRRTAPLAHQLRREDRDHASVLPWRDDRDGGGVLELPVKLHAEAHGMGPERPVHLCAAPLADRPHLARTGGRDGLEHELRPRHAGLGREPARDLGRRFTVELAFARLEPRRVAAARTEPAGLERHRHGAGDAVAGPRHVDASGRDRPCGRRHRARRRPCSR